MPRPLLFKRYEHPVFPLVLFLFVVTILFSCKETKKTSDPEFDKAQAALELMSYERDFSVMSGTKGMKAAFIEYLDSNGVLLRPHQFPISGAGAIDYLIQQNDGDYTFTWDPQQAAVSKSGDLGYTYGVFIMKPVTADTMYYGTYTHIWKKQPDGKWKLVLNTFNEGVDPVISSD